ncbi:hypothetical protein GCM10010280_66360 [Streptomyces pilosus]|uniref:Uncharacterized protein n=1 Tax=Streptomyces pilosus TaxID=28893 RepID=A0A918C7X9_9ACTN|nr:hypothetical protein GCM10010280_66360 [Streptomyces pilosus]
MPAELQWGTGPFDSDSAADFVDATEGLPYQQVIDVSGRASQRVTDSGEHVDGKDGPKPVPPAPSSPAPARTVPS